MRILRELAEQAQAYEGEQVKLKTRLAERAQLTEHALQNASAQHALSIAEKQLAQMRASRNRVSLQYILQYDFRCTRILLRIFFRVACLRKSP